MSYEGYYEWLCEQGHYQAVDCYEDDPKVCKVCGQGMAYSHSVDQTNGYDESHEATCDAPTVEIGVTDIWKDDRWGNRYAHSVKRLTPAPGSHWHRIRQAHTG